MIVHLHRKFEKKFVKLPKKLREQFKTRRDLFLSDPRHPLLENHPLSGDRAGQWSINVTGDYRAIYKFLAPSSIIFVDIDTHDKLYGK